MTIQLNQNNYLKLNINHRMYRQFEVLSLMKKKNSKLNLYKMKKILRSAGIKKYQFINFRGVFFIHQDLKEANLI